MGLLFAWGDDANFVVSVGGFHPQFNPPPLPFPTPQRIQLDIINESYARIHADGYFAVTTNTAQFGTHASYFFGFSALSVEGSSGFDALIQFSPFHFTVAIQTSSPSRCSGSASMASASISPSTVRPAGTPTAPHRCRSSSSRSTSASTSPGARTEDTSLPPVAVMPLLSAELGKQSNWRAFLPPGRTCSCRCASSTRPRPPSCCIRSARLRVSQRLVPLDLTLDKFGNQQPSDANRFALTVTARLSKLGNLQEQFAPAQFRNIDDAGKLSQPAYVPQDSGIELAVTGSPTRPAPRSPALCRYDITIIDTKLLRAFSKFFTSPRLLQPFPARRRRRPVRAFGLPQAKTNPYGDPVTVAPETFVSRYDPTTRSIVPDAAAFTSQAAANDYVARAVAGNPTLNGTLHVLPQFEWPHEHTTPMPPGARHLLVPAVAAAGHRQHDHVGRQRPEREDPRERARRAATRRRSGQRHAELTAPPRRTSPSTGPATSSASTSAPSSRTDPRPWITNYESNYLAAVEFYDEDFPWRYTPAPADRAQAASLAHPDRPAGDRVQRGPGRRAAPRRASTIPNRAALPSPESCGPGRTCTSTRASPVPMPSTVSPDMGAVLPRVQAIIGAESRTSPIRASSARAGSTTMRAITPSWCRPSRPGGSPASARTRR